MSSPSSIYLGEFEQLVLLAILRLGAEASGVGIGKDIYREALAAVASAISNAFGGEDVSFETRAGRSIEDQRAQVEVDGEVHVGINRRQELEIDFDGTVIRQVGDISITRTDFRDVAKDILDSLTPPLRERAVAYMKELDIPPERVRTMRPWFAYYAFAMAFDARRQRPAGTQSPEAVLAGLAKESSKKIGYEKSMATWVESLATMPEEAQSQYIQWLFDYFDEQNAGKTVGW